MIFWVFFFMMRVEKATYFRRRNIIAILSLIRILLLACLWINFKYSFNGYKINVPCTKILFLQNAFREPLSNSAASGKINKPHFRLEILCWKFHLFCSLINNYSKCYILLLAGFYIIFYLIRLYIKLRVKNLQKKFLRNLI